jgi:hypothetical protein
VADFDTFVIGGVTYPLTTQATGTSLVDVCDPALAKLISFISFRVNLYLGDALTGAVAAGNPPIGANVRRTFSQDALSLIAKAEQAAFPFLAIWRKKSKFDDRTSNWRQDTCTMGFAYVLPPMTLEQGEKFAHVLHAVTVIVKHSLYLGFDPAYNDSERIFETSGIASARLTTATYEPYRIGDLTDTHFNAVVGELEVVEQVTPSDGGLQKLTVSTVKITDESTQPGNPDDVINARV